jgi:RNA polymerase sigma-70 factor (ECF subfamily)
VEPVEWPKFARKPNRIVVRLNRPDRLKAGWAVEIKPRLLGVDWPESPRFPNDEMDSQEHNDWELMQRVAASDEVAIDELYRRFGALVYQSARQVLRSRAETEDAVQEVFVRLWKTADRFDPHRAKLVTWVMLISRRHLIDRLRRQSARPDRAELDTSRTDAGGAVARPEAEGRMEGEEGRERLKRQLARLPELQRSVIERAYLQGFSLREIAEQLNSPLGTVKSALSRGLTRLRELEGAREERG